MRVFVLALASAVLLTGAASGSAQTVSVPESLYPDEREELQRWIDDFTAWQQWWTQWASRREPGWLTSSRPRREKPAPPEWLAGRCAEVFVDTDMLAPACALLKEWRESDVAALSDAARVVTIQRKEDQPKTVWWEHVHVDLLWPATQIRDHVYGVIGVHTATTVRGRVQVFLTPGVMLMNVPQIDGTRVWRFAADYGIGYRLLDFTFPGGRPASLHVNIAKSWLFSDTKDLIVGRSLDFAGFSISFKR